MNNDLELRPNIFTFPPDSWLKKDWYESSVVKMYFGLEDRSPSEIEKENRFIETFLFMILS